jgi:hypothetical protein
MQLVTIHKRDQFGRETWQYSGQVLTRGDTWVNFEARFNIPGEKDAGYTVFRFNDRFVEWYYTDRWYNIAAVYDVRDDQLKGWYCNLTRPAIITSDSADAAVDVFWDDLALDVWVDPQGGIQILDEDEFAELKLDSETAAQVWDGVDQLRALVKARLAPFDTIS